MIGNDPTSDLFADGVKNIVTVSRIYTMNPDSSENLERFIAAYEKAGEYILTQAKLNGGQIHLAATNEISKKRIVIREAWEVGPHDPDSVGISLDDDPVMPRGVQDPPVMRTLERMRQAR